ncbi:MAG TPA: histidine--tRNA ligase [Terriglobia bacterium]|nr:histidine--tRNA ligase [Terriglobia bacterium]
MTKSIQPIRSVKGTRDLLPPETGLWQRVEDEARAVFAVYNFREIRTPVIESTALFARGVGEETDIVTKEMFTFVDRDHESLTLRPEGTAGVVRAAIEHSLYNLGGIQRLFYTGPMFRRERPQKGRYRQFYQIGAEALGSEHPLVDVEVLEMLMVFLGRVGLSDLSLLMNSVGCGLCRPEYLRVLRRALEAIKSQLCADCQRRAETNPLRVLDCKVPADQALVEKLPTIFDHLGPECRQHFDRVTAELTDRGIRFTLMPRLVRGLDYYTRTAFEITSGSLGAQNALLGGGRYDGLSETIGGPPMSGFGFAIGEDRLLMAVEEAGKLTRPEGIDVYVAWMDDRAFVPARDLVRSLRAEDLSVEMNYEPVKLKKMLGAANRRRARFAVIIGESELAASRFQVKDMSSSEQHPVEPDRVAAFVREKRSSEVQT